VHIDSITDLIENGKTGSMLHLPHGVRAVKSYNTLKICLHELKEEDIYFNKEVTYPELRLLMKYVAAWRQPLLMFRRLLSIEDFTKVPDKSKVQFLIMTG